MHFAKRPFTLLLIVLLLLASLSGCSAPDSTASTQSDSVPGTQSTASLTEYIAPDHPQYDSLNMLNHLVALIQEINVSRHDRLYLEQAYLELYNNTNPESVNASTLTEITHLLNTMEKYRMVSVKRERLQYVYEQNRAQATRAIVPSPLAVLNAVQSSNLKRLIGSLIYMGVDSYTRYQSASHEAELEFVQEGWKLDDEADEALHAIRVATFEYIVDMVRSEQLPGHLALNEKSVSEFVEWKNKPGTAQKIQFFESNRDTYRAFGQYWLTLAQCYYEAEDYASCLEAVDEYEALNVSIFRRNYGLANVLPLAIVSAGEALPQEEYIQAADRYAALILANTDNSDWALRYFAAQTYLELYALSERSVYLNAAYDIALDNVNYLSEEQKRLNEVYLSDIQTVSAPKGATKAQKNEIKAYNEMLEEIRSVELPPVYEPLLLNCELLFALADEKNISSQEMKRIDDILHGSGQPLFLVKPLEQNYTFTKAAETAEPVMLEFSSSELIVPAEYVSDNAKICVTVSNGTEAFFFEDWMLDEVDRNKSDNVSAFTATYTSQSAKQFSYDPDMTVHVSILSEEGSSTEPLECTFRCVRIKHLWLIPGIAFERVE